MRLCATFNWRPTFPYITNCADFASPLDDLASTPVVADEAPELLVWKPIDAKKYAPTTIPFCDADFAALYDMEAHKEEQPTPSSQKRRRMSESASEESNIVIDLCEDSDSEDEDSESDDEEEEDIRLLLFKNGVKASIKEKQIVDAIKRAATKQRVRMIATANSVPKSIDTVFCVYDDADDKVARLELLNDLPLMTLCLEGRLRAVPLSKVHALLCDGRKLSTTALDNCAFAKRATSEKVKASFEVVPLVPAHWRIPCDTIRRTSQPTLCTRERLMEYLQQQMFARNE